jgi:diaminohydroxyphosphoribosylaminopyrimidine deaminase/5-amino-6-(5-phosphoribosylamino)uracil reductase
MMKEPISQTEQYMVRALELGRRAEGRTRPNPAVGAVIVRDGRVVGEGFHPRAGEPHAEIFALRQAGELARGADLYVTLEPCSHQGRTGPCAEALIAAGIGRVFIGTEDPNPRVAGSGIARLREAGIPVHLGVLETECLRLIAPFAKHVTTGLPYVILKSAVTLDGKTATSTGDSQWISGPASRERVHRLRDRVDGIMVGIGTVLRDNPRLTTRLPEEGGRDATRIVVDTSLRIPEDAAILTVRSEAPTVIATTRLAPEAKVARLRAKGIEVLTVPEGGGRIDLADLMRQLGARGMQSILLEGGSALNASALESGLVDWVMVFVAPMLVGGEDGKGIFAGQGVARLVDAIRLGDVRVSRFGDDILIEGEVRQCLPA